MDNDIKKLVSTCTDEIFSTIEWSTKNNINFPFHTANYWVHDNYNIFAMTVNENNLQYIELKLEQYDDEENCINVEFDYQETADIQKESLLNAIAKLINRNLANINA